MSFMEAREMPAPVQPKYLPYFMGGFQIKPQNSNQFGKLWGAVLKWDELILARSGRSLAQTRASLQVQAVAKLTVVAYFWNILRQNAQV